MSRILGSRFVLGLASVLLFLGAWQVLGTRANPLFFSTPVAVAQGVPILFGRDHLLNLYVNTMAVFMLSLLGTIVIGLVFGVATGLSRPARYFTDPLVIVLYSTPALVLIPLFVLWFGIGNEPKIALVFLSAFFPMLINTQLGVDDIGAHMNELGRSFGATQWEMITKIVLPSILPYVLAGIRIAVPRAFVAVIAAEMLITAQGLGGLALKYGNQYQTDLYWGPVLLLVITSYVLTEMSKALERVLTPWRRSWAEGRH